MRCFVLALVLLAAASVGHAQAIPVEVVDISGRTAYLTPGQGEGVLVGASVRIGNSSYEVVAVTTDTAAIEIEDKSMRIGARGTAERIPPDDESDRTVLPEVIPLENFEGQWSDATRPADEQDPEFVPLTDVAARSRRPFRFAADLGGRLLFPIGETQGSIHRLTGRIRLHAEPFQERPFTIDIDAGASVWLGADVSSRDGDSSRPYVFVRRLELQYGDDAHVALGRFRRMAQVLGPMDGIRVRSPSFNGFSAAAFGGLVPDARSGIPQPNVGRFGVELRYDDAEHALRPSVAVLAHGSYFGGIDEKRVAITASLFPDVAAITGFAELSLFDSDNPWAAKSIELTALSADGSVYFGNFTAHAHYGLRKPERSRFLASLLPAEWLCSTTPFTGSPTNEPCRGFGETRHFGALDLSGRFGERIEVRAAGSVAMSTGDEQMSMGTGSLQLRVVRIADRFDFGLSGEVGGGSVARRAGGRLSFGGFALQERLDFELSYGLAAGQLRADQVTFLEHRANGSVHLALASEERLRLRLVADVLLGGPASVLAIDAGLTYLF